MPSTPRVMQRSPDSMYSYESCRCSRVSASTSCAAGVQPGIRPADGETTSEGASPAAGSFQNQSNQYVA